MNENKTNINWYPGHIRKAENEIKENLKLIDIVVEVLDARIPIASSNPIVNEFAKDKKRIIVLNKSDLADKENLSNWVKKFEQEGYTCIVTNANISENIEKIVQKIKEIGKLIYDEKYTNKKVQINPIYRVLIVGIPNVGKSTIINKIAKKNVAKASNKPGVTVKKQWIRVSQNIELLDTPGLLWPKLDNNQAGIKLALTGNIKQEILDVEELATIGISMLLKTEKYKEMLKGKYNLQEQDLNLESYDLLEVIGQKRGCLVSKGNVDVTRAAKLFLEDFKNGKIGNISLE